MTVRWRLTLIATVVFGVAFIAAAVALVAVTRSNLVDAIQSTQKQQIDGLETQLKENADQAQQYESDGRVYCCLPDGRPYTLARPRPPQDNYVETQRQIEIAGQNVTIVAQRSLAEVNSSVDKLKTIMWFAVPTLIALVGFAVWYLAGRALRPVEAIRSEAEEITGTTLDRRVPEPRTHDEVGKLARTMNAMLDRLERSSQKQRQFVSDASHELRSPIASIRTNLEVALRNAGAADWPAVADRALAEDARMEEMVTDLLDLARLDEDTDSEPVSSLPEVDVDELVLDETLRPHRVFIDTTRVSAGRVHGRREQLGRVVRNLIDNADRHAASRVAISLQNGADVVELTVDDDGPGIAPDDRARVFERFTRLDDARARDDGGLGLGLSMVKTIVERHGGTVEIEDAPIGGARVAVRLPAV
ncbi:MAG: sensor histidine kinase [Acidimicrobiia bacterium]